jgi:hypothetical protein
MAEANAWQVTGEPAPGELVEARLQLHWAAQVLCATADAMLEHQPDDSHSNQCWNEELQALTTHANPIGLFGALRPVDLNLMLADQTGMVIDHLKLDGRTIQDGLEWLEGLATEISGEPLPQPLKLRGYEMPEHPVGKGEPFDFKDPDAFAEVGRWFASAHHVLGEVQQREPNASPVRCWPHHFDIATLITLDPGKDPERARAIGVGLSPGDGSYAEPYFYVNPWPSPQNPNPPALETGQWHTAGFFGAVLTGSEITGIEGNEARLARLNGFLNVAIDADYDLLGGRPG